MGLEAIYQAPRTSTPHPQHRIYPYLLRNLTVVRPDHVWCADITYIPVRRGFLYTPNEIVRFMIESADWLCQKHFNKRLIDKNVEILDPATGTGTFIVDLLEYFRGQPAKLRHKYLEELHANEVAILPYYVANLNIEATYAAITGSYEEYPNLCFVDTLDNVAGLRSHGVGNSPALLHCRASFAGVYAS
jgi:hypothetical protein